MFVAVLLHFGRILEFTLELTLLKIDVDELEIIRKHPQWLTAGVKGYFREILVMWLKQAPPNHQLPCLESLVI